MLAMNFGFEICSIIELDFFFKTIFFEVVASDFASFETTLTVVFFEVAFFFAVFPSLVYTLLF